MNKIKLTVYGVLLICIIGTGILVYFNGTSPFLVYTKLHAIPGKIINLNKEFTLEPMQIGHLRNQDLSFYYFLEVDDNEDSEVKIRNKIHTVYFVADKSYDTTDEINYKIEIKNKTASNVSFIISNK
ncbi:MAG: hypothetical protein V1898_02940 [Patescibacteria group bacterium]